jgi:4'-phosphopantetheinyl transferase
MAPAEDVAHVWSIRLDGADVARERLVTILDEAERQRTARFRFARDADRFVVAHGAVRTILAAYLRCEPAEVTFVTGPHGKPTMAPRLARHVDFNLSHSDALALCAVTRDRRVGVDVEKIRNDFAIDDIARAYFSAAERAALMRLAAPLRTAAFFSCWTRKEAYIKARGDGLSVPLDCFDVAVAPDAPAALLATRPDPDEARQWSLVDLDVDPRYAAALVIEGQAPRIVPFEWRPPDARVS